VCFRDNATISLPVNPDISVVRVIFVIYFMFVRGGALFPINKGPHASCADITNPFVRVQILKSFASDAAARVRKQPEFDRLLAHVLTTDPA
jgi:hypothetical protein